MSVLNDILDDSVEIIPYNQDEIEEEVKKILLNNGMVDIQYPGSNVSQLANVMSYLIHVLNTNTAINLKEVLLPLATKRTNVLWGARQLGYEPTQKISYVYKLKVNINKNPLFGMNPGEPGYSDTWEVIFAKYTKLLSGSNTYYYLDDDIKIVTSNELIDNEDDTSYFYINVKEGVLTKFEDNDLLVQRSFNIIDENGEVRVKQNYIIPFENVEENGLEVFLSYIDEDGIEHIREKWEKSDYFLIDDSLEINKHKYARIQNILLNVPEIYFEVGEIGPKIRLNTLIETNVLQSSGKLGEAGTSFALADQVASQIFVINSFEEIQRGHDEESSTSIKQNAPIFNNTGNRLVTANDYVAMAQKHEKVHSAICWGTEEETARDYALVYLSMTPERTIREFKSVYKTDDNNDENDNELSPDNTYFVLQRTPNHPYTYTSEGKFYMGSDSDNGTPPTSYPDKNNFPVGTTWEIDFDDTNGDGTMDIFGGDLDGQIVALGDKLFLADDGSGGKVFQHKSKLFMTPEQKEELYNWYLDGDLDILDNFVDNFDSSTSKVFTYLKPNKIMSIENTFRQPIYCDFEFRVNLLQNTISVNYQEVNQKVFDIISNYFYLEIEKFDSIFLLSTLISKISEYISDINGVNIDFKNKLVLHPYLYDYELSKFNSDIKNMFISLAFPFENIYDIENNNQLTTKYLPQISCDDYPLYVDFDAFWTRDQDAGDPVYVTDEVIGCPIHAGTDNTGHIVGYYFIRNDYQMNIEIQLYFSDDGSLKTGPQGDFEFIDLTKYPVTANIKEDEFFVNSGYGFLNLVYPNIDTQDWHNVEPGVNIPFTKYTLPRLKSVEFIKGSLI